MFLDYDGTLVPFSRYPEAAVPGKDLLAQLKRLEADARNTVVIVSGRRREFLDRWFGDLRAVLVAEHGAFMRMVPADWASEVDADPAWKQQVLPVLQRYADRCTGAFIEEKDLSLVWHYRNADAGIALLRSQELKDGAARAGRARPQTPNRRGPQSHRSQEGRLRQRHRGLETAGFVSP